MYIYIVSKFTSKITFPLGHLATSLIASICRAKNGNGNGILSYRLLSVGVSTVEKIMAVYIAIPSNVSGCVLHKCCHQHNMNLCYVYVSFGNLPNSSLCCIYTV